MGQKPFGGAGVHVREDFIDLCHLFGEVHVNGAGACLFQDGGQPRRINGAQGMRRDARDEIRLRHRSRRVRASA